MRNKQSIFLLLGLLLMLVVGIAFCLFLWLPASSPSIASRGATSPSVAPNPVRKPPAPHPIKPNPTPQAANLPWSGASLVPADRAKTAAIPGQSFGIIGNTASLTPSNGRIQGQPIHVAKATLTTQAAATELKLAAENIQPELPKFVMSMCRDLQGNLWVGAEDDGVFRYDVQKKKWTRFTEKDGLGDNNGYAVVCDRMGRIWVGHLNHGVSVYNGQKWQCYEVVGGLSRPDTLSGPLGDRVFDIAVNQVDGDVWISTNYGLARYSESKDIWTYYTRAEGMPSDQVQAIAFDKDGNIYCGTQCDGMAIAGAKDNYKSWQQVIGPDEMPTDPTGEGLPTNLINDVLVTKDDTVYAATTTGLAWSKDRGKSWRYVRGVNWANKVRGLLRAPDKNWEEKPGAFLAEDYITSLSEDASGKIYAGYRQRGYQGFTRALVPLNGTINDAFSKAILVSENGEIVLGTYGNGIQGSILGMQSKAEKSHLNNAVSNPSETKLLNVSDIESSNNILDSEAVSSGVGKGVFLLNDDWKTRGNWLGRYGKFWACLSGICSPKDYLWGSDATRVPYKVSLGPHHSRGDSVRSWVHALYTDRIASLEMPPVYMHSRVVKGLTTWEKNRRQAEWDDHGEGYPMSMDGPDLYINMQVPAGRYVLSLYNVNKDGHSGDNRFRDYPVSVTAKTITQANLPNDNIEINKAHCRIVDFWGGVYKKFLVYGPVNLTVKIDRNGSLNTICAALMLDDTRNDGLPSTVNNKQNSISDLDAILIREAERSAYVETSLTRTHGPSRSTVRSYLQICQKELSSATEPERRERLLVCAAKFSVAIGEHSASESFLKELGLQTARDNEKAKKWVQKPVAVKH